VKTVNNKKYQLTNDLLTQLILLTHVQETSTRHFWKFLASNVDV